MCIRIHLVYYLLIILNMLNNSWDEFLFSLISSSSSYVWKVWAALYDEATLQEDSLLVETEDTRINQSETDAAIIT